MELASDLLSGLRSQVQGGPGAGARPGLDWSGLHARLAAAHAVRTQLAALDPNRGHAVGGFENWRNFAVAAGKSLPDVNPTDLADGKSRGAMMAPAPEIPLPAAEDNDD